MRSPSLPVVSLALALLAIPPAAAGQACLGRPAPDGGYGVSASYEPQVDGWGGALDMNLPGLWSFRVQGGRVGELVDQEELDTFVGWTKIGTTVEVLGEVESTHPIVTRRAKENFLGAEGLVELVLSDFSLCAGGGVQIRTGEADLNQRITYLDAIGPRWVRSMQDFSGVRAPMTVAAGHRGMRISGADLIPYVSFTYWVDRVTFDRVSDGFTYEGWYGQGGATLVLGEYAVGLGFRTADDLTDESFLASVGYTF